MNMFVDVQYILKIISHNMLEKTHYINVNNMKSVQYLFTVYMDIQNPAKFKKY